MRKVSTILLSALVFASFVIGASSSWAVHKSERSILWCDITSDSGNLADLHIDVTESQRLQFIKAPATLSADTEVVSAGGKAIFVDPRPGSNPTSEGDISSFVVLSVEKNVREICTEAGEIKTRTIEVIEKTTGCIVGNVDDISGDKDVVIKGLNIQFLDMTFGDGEGKEIVGIVSGGSISNVVNEVSVSLIGREYNSFIAEWSPVISVGTLGVHRETIAHNANTICSRNAAGLNNGATTPISGGSAPPAGSSPGSGGLPSSSPGSGGSVVAGGNIKESCTLSKKVKYRGEIFDEGDIVGPNITANWGTVCLINTINTVTGWAFFLLVSVAFILILIAGFLWMTTGGDAAKQKQAGGMIAAALVGIVIAILSRIIPGVVIGILS